MSVREFCARFPLYSCTLPFSDHLLCASGIFLFSVRVFFHRHWRLTEQQGKVGDILLFHFSTSTHSRTFRNLFSTLLCMWDDEYYIFLIPPLCIYQTATRWDLPLYRITIWLIGDVRLIFVCLLDDFIVSFCYCIFDTGSRWTRTRIDYHPCITSKPTIPTIPLVMLPKRTLSYEFFYLLNIFFFLSKLKQHFLFVFSLF